MKVQYSSSSPVAVIGAGPVGLAAAAHLVRRGLPVVVLEAGTSVAAHLGSYRQVRLFSPWRYNIDRAARELLDAAGWVAPEPDKLPTAGELVNDYLAPLARTAALAPHIQFGTRVMAVSRDGFDKAKTAGREQADFVLQVQTAEGMREMRARAVIDASGTWSQPNPLGVHGLPVPGEGDARARIVHGMPDVLGTDRSRYAGRKVLVVGAGHSAAGNLLALATLAEAEPATRLAWAVRGNDLRRLFGGGENDGLPARGELGVRLRALVEQGRLEMHLGFGIREVAAGPQGLRVLAIDATKEPIEGIDEIIASTGARPDLSIARELRLRLDPWLESTDALAPLIDPNVHSCGTVRPHGHRELAHPEAGFYAIGAKSYGRAPNFLLATGYEQARSVVAALAGDLSAADDVQLELPQTGVCSVDLGSPPAGEAGTGCCGGPAKADATACCVLDETSKAQGKPGCGCGSKTAPAPIEPVAQVASTSASATAACCG
ncbi:MAG: flavoprotein [Betaproteobacteria bacterium HGW-Betaproteobacteria-16]|nr:MAG: flavoprotein [Betaproteobacteria bacterium HGW-Betaproteobacteria-16]